MWEEKGGMWLNMAYCFVIKIIILLKIKKDLVKIKLNVIKKICLSFLIKCYNYILC